jgi:hypothetical protein
MIKQKYKTENKKVEVTLRGFETLKKQKKTKKEGPPLLIVGKNPGILFQKTLLDNI